MPGFLIRPDVIKKTGEREEQAHPHGTCGFIEPQDLRTQGEKVTGKHQQNADRAQAVENGKFVVRTRR